MKLKTIIFTAIIGFVLIIIYVNIYNNPTLLTKVNADNILKIEPGMTLEQVFSILDKPLKISALRGIHNINCSKPNPILEKNVNDKTDIRKLVNDFISSQKYCCEGNKEDIEQLNNITLTYTKEEFYFSYPMLWIHLDKSYKVTSIYAKEYEAGFIGDNSEIYSFNWVLDSKNTKSEKSINKEKFFRNFK